MKKTKGERLKWKPLKSIEPLKISSKDINGRIVILTKTYKKVLIE